MDKQNILSKGLNSIEPIKNLLSENQLSQQVSYPELFKNKEGSPNILNGFVDTNISIISEQTLQKRVRSQIVKRHVHQNRNFQNAMCQIINQSEDQHAILSYQEQDNNQPIQHISTKKLNFQIAQQQNQKIFWENNNCSQNSFGNQESQIQQNQISVEVISNNQANFQYLQKLQENSFINEQKYDQLYEKNQSLKYEQITDQVNFDEYENILMEKNCSQDYSNKKEDQIKIQQNFQEMNTNYQVNYIQLKKDNAQTLHKNDQQQDINQQSLNQEQIGDQQNVYKLEITDRIDFMHDKKCSYNDLTKKKGQIQQMLTTIQDISNDQINVPQNIESQLQVKNKETQLKNEQQHSQEKSLNYEEIQSIESEKQPKSNENIQEQYNLTKCFSTQLKMMFKVIEDYKFSEFDQSGELKQTGCEVKKLWDQQNFEKIED
ncbi:hypothetical protein ABPG73_006361 [Tetrahymena malaccensis]